MPSPGRSSASRRSSSTRLAEVHEAPAAPGAHGHVSGVAHRLLRVRRSSRSASARPHRPHVALARRAGTPHTVCSPTLVSPSAPASSITSLDPSTSSATGRCRARRRVGRGVAPGTRAAPGGRGRRARRRASVSTTLGTTCCSSPERGQAELVQLPRSRTTRVAIDPLHLARRMRVRSRQEVRSVCLGVQRVVQRRRARRSAWRRPRRTARRAPPQPARQGERQPAPRRARTTQRFARASSISMRTPKPDAPLPTYGRSSPHAVPAMSMCTHGRVAHELLEELGRGDRRRPCGPPGALSRSAYLPLTSSPVLGVQRQAPAELAGGGGGAVDLGEPVVVVGEQARVGRAQRHDDRAGQRGQVDHPLGALLDRVVEGVGEDQPALGVGVVDLDRLAVRRRSRCRRA